MKNSNQYMLFAFAILLVFFPFILAAQNCSCVPEPSEFRAYVKASEMERYYNGGSLDGLNYDYRGAKENCWRVYSDRDDNKLYASPAGLETGKVLSLMEMLRVCEVSGNWIKVISLESTAEQGWIKAENLVLNSYAILNEHGITRKALVLISLDNTNMSQMQNIKDADLDQYKFFTSPVTTQENYKSTETSFSIYYVLKDTRGAMLLSKIDKLDNLGAGTLESIGWIRDIHVTPWDSKVCLEPQYNNPYSDAYKDVSIPVFHEFGDLNAYLQMNSANVENNKVAMNWEVSNKRINKMRMPILEHIDTDLKKVATVGYIGEQIELQEQLKEKYDTEKEIDRKQKSRLNVLYVVDATSSLDDYQQMAISE